MEVFSARLKWLRTKNGFTQKQMASLLDISQQYYGRFESDKGEPNLETLVKISKLLNESTDFLLGLQELDSVAKEKYAELEKMQKKMNLFIEHFNSNFLSADQEVNTLLQKSAEQRIKAETTRLNKIKKEFVLYAVQIPFTKFNGAGIIDENSDIIFDPSTIPLWNSTDE